ncbi:MAG: hypothetical protein JXQ96_03240 [Cyclobacteriaceae bacterium]
MKRFFTLLFIIFSAFDAQSQDSSADGPSKTVMKIQPQQFIDHTFFLALEKFNKDYGKSFMLGLGLTSTNNEYSESGYKAEIQYRYYPLKFTENEGRKAGSKYHGGIYASIYLHHSYNVRSSPYYDYNNPDPTPMENKRKILAFNPGVTIGYQKTFFEKLYLDVYVGGGIRTTNVSDSQSGFIDYNDGIFDENYKGIFPKIGFSIGLGL